MRTNADVIASAAAQAMYTDADIELLPAWNIPDVKKRLAAAVKSCEGLHASVAYWTVAPHFVTSTLATRLRAPHGCLCVDLHLPTDIDQLASLVRQGADVRIYCEDIAIPRGQRELPFLLHTKILLFLNAEDRAELWVGSHNWTVRSLFGLNVEASLVISLSRSSTLFREAMSFLDNIQSLCEPFDLSRIDFYKQLQRPQSEPTVPSIEIEASDAVGLKGVAITLFGSETDELREVGALRQVYVSAFDRITGAEHLYSGTVLQSGLMPRLTPTAPGMSFDARRYAFRKGRRFPSLSEQSSVPDDVLNNANYFVAVNITEHETLYQALDPASRESAWVEVDPASSPLVRRLAAQAPENLQAIFRGRGPIVRKPTDQVGSVIPRAADLAERRAMSQHNLIVRKILRKRS